MRRNVKTMVGLAVALGYVGAVAPTDAALIVSRYEFEDNTNDSAGTYHATTSNSPGYVPGVFGQAISLNGTDAAPTPMQLVQVAQQPGNTAFDPGNSPFSDEFTLAMWLDPADVHINYRMIASNTSTTSSGNGFNLFLSSTGRLTFEVNKAGTKYGVRTNSTSMVPYDTGWTHLAVKVDRSEGLVQFFKDGALMANQTATGLYQTLPVEARDFSLDNVWRMGATGTGGGILPFRGAIDDARLYSGLLTDAEIAALAVVPEPSATLALVGLGGLVLRRRR